MSRRERVDVAARQSDAKFNIKEIDEDGGRLREEDKEPYQADIQRVSCHGEIF